MSSLSSQGVRVIGFALTMIVNSAIVLHFYDHFWWPVDDGHYAHFAERILHGEILYRDIEEYHTDYAYLSNALALKLLGPDLRSLRVPLAIVTILQSGVVYLLFGRRPVWTAAAASLATAALSFIQFLNPQPHWYCLALTIAVMSVLRWMRPGAPGRLELLGLLVASIFLFRQLTGAFVAAGLLAFLLIEENRARGGSRVWLARTVLAGLLVALLAYSWSASNAVGLLLFSIWPLTILVWAIAATSARDEDVAVTLLRLSVGGALGLAPLVVFHALHGSIDAWLTNVFWRSLSVQRLWYLDESRYTWLVSLGLRQILDPQTPARFLNGLYWTTLPLLGLLNGILTLRHLQRAGHGPDRVEAVPIIAAFYGLVSLFNQIPIYLYYTVSLSLLGVLWLQGASRNGRSVLLAVAVLSLCATAVAFHAAQPLSRTLEKLVAGRRVALTLNNRFDRASLWLEPRDIAVYSELLDVIRQNTGPGDPIFVFPNHPEIYFLAERTNPFSFVNTALAVRSEDDVARVLDRLAERSVALLVYVRDDKHGNAYSESIRRLASARYDLLTSIGSFDVYRRHESKGRFPGHAPPAAAAGRQQERAGILRYPWPLEPSWVPRQPRRRSRDATR